MVRERTGAWSASGQAELENRIVLLRVELEIYAGAYIIVFIHYTNSSAYSATGYIIVCIQGKASH